MPGKTGNNAEGRQEGLSDFTETFFFSPDQSLGKGLYWGAGPTFILPTASSDLLGSGQYSVGPSIGIFTQQKPWTAGFILNHEWSIANSDTAPVVNVTSFRPVVTYTAPKSTSIYVRSRASYSW